MEEGGERARPAVQKQGGGCISGMQWVLGGQEAVSRDQWSESQDASDGKAQGVVMARGGEG